MICNSKTRKLPAAGWLNPTGMDRFQFLNLEGTNVTDDGLANLRN